MSDHLIHRQVLDLQVPTRQEALAVQEAFRQWYWDTFLPLLDEVFAQLSGGRHIRIQQLTMDLGPFSLSDIREWPREKIRQMIVEQIEQTMAEANYGGRSSQNVQTFESSQNTFDALSWFLLHGTLPWWQSGNDPQILSILLKQVIQQQPDQLQSFLRKNQQSFVAERLSKQFTLEQLLPVFHQMDTIESGAAEKIWQALLPVLKKMRSLSGDFSALESLFSLTVLQTIFLQKEKAPELLLEKFLHALATRLEKEYAQVLRRISSLVRQTQPADQGLMPLVEKLSTRAKISADNDRENLEIPATEHPGPSKDPVNAFSEILTDEILRETQFVNHAGLVLLWPYLGSFFRKLDLLKGSEFRNEKAHERAVLLSHYLAGGNTSSAEHLLLMPKLLCGWPVQQPVAARFTLSKKEKAEANDLLTSVIANWQVLKNTSVDGFQASFLQRSGKLFFTEEQLELQIERKGIDVLLDQLPWSIATVKMAWMPLPVLVEW